MSAHPSTTPARQTTMSSRERMNAAIERRPHDRVPRYDTYWGDTLRNWKEQGLVGGAKAALDLLQADLACISDFHWPSPYPGRNETISEDDETRVFLDEWGETLRLFKGHQTTPEHIGWECDDPDVWYDKFRQRILDSNPKVDFDALLRRQADAQQRQKWTFFNAVEPFECLRKLIGDEETMIGMKEEPEWIVDVAEVTTTRSLRHLQDFLDVGLKPDGLWIYGDMAFNHSTMCSPADYKELIWPSHKRFCDWAHENGMKVIYHTDGNVNAVVDLYLEAGVDLMQPLECKANMNICDLVPKYGDRMSFFGNIDVMALITGDLDIIEEEIKTKFAAGMSSNGYIYHSDHSVPPQVSWPLYCKIIKLVDRHGWYD